MIPVKFFNNKANSTSHAEFMSPDDNLTEPLFHINKDGNFRAKNPQNFTCQIFDIDSMK